MVSVWELIEPTSGDTIYSRFPGRTRRRGSAHRSRRWELPGHGREAETSLHPGRTHRWSDLCVLFNREGLEGGHRAV